MLDGRACLIFVESRNISCFVGCLSSWSCRLALNCSIFNSITCLKLLYLVIGLSSLLFGELDSADLFSVLC